jgi:RimJ/RimL family protein N-acetyltransferase
MKRLSMRTTKGNRKLRRVAEFIGFKFEGVARRGHLGTHDAMMYGLVPEQCRFWKG